MSVSDEVISNIRTQFLAQVEQNPDKYHQKDVERVKTNDWWIERFVLVNKTEDKALKNILKTMEWRKSFGVNDFTDQYFPKELYEIGYFSIFPEKDREGRTIVWHRGSRFHNSDLTPMIRQFVVYQFEKADRNTSNQGWAVITDTTDTVLSNVDIDFNNFLTMVHQTHYPRGAKYLAVVDLPWILMTAFKLIMSFTNEEMKNRVKLIKKEDLIQYMDPQHIPVHLNGLYDKDITFIPTDAKPLDQNRNFTADQIKKIRSAYKEVLEY